MINLLGLILLVAGCVMLYLGWQAHEAALAIAASNPAQASGSQSVWLLTAGAISVVWGLAVALRRRV
jgi:hypothetical protein